MKLIVCRHGHAAPGDYSRSDEARWISEQGREQARISGEKLAALNLCPASVVASPLVRTVQTAEVVARAAGFAGAITTSDLLRSGGQPLRFLDTVDSVEEPMLLVAHHPEVSLILSHLCEQVGRSFETGELAFVEDDALRWRFVPEGMRFEKFSVS